jgi:hypothetical protein
MNDRNGKSDKNTDKSVDMVGTQNVLSTVKSFSWEANTGPAGQGII